MNILLNILGWVLIAAAGSFLWRNIRSAPVPLMPEANELDLAKDLCDAIEEFSGSAALCFDPALKFIAAGGKGELFIAGSDGEFSGRGHLLDVIPAILTESFSYGALKAREKGRRSWEFLSGEKKMLARAVMVKTKWIVIEIKEAELSAGA